MLWIDAIKTGLLSHPIHDADMVLGAFIFFGALTFLGAGFIWFYVPETSRLTLEEMDTIFGSTGLVKSDADRMVQIQREVGLTALIHGNSQKASDDEEQEAQRPSEKAIDSIQEA